MQGSNIFDGILKTMIKEDHFACTTRMFECGSLIHNQVNPTANSETRLYLSGPRCTPTPPDSHPRGCPTIHLSKNKFLNLNHKPLRQNNLPPRFMPTKSLLNFSGEADVIVCLAVVNRCCENLFFRLNTGENRHKHVHQPDKATSYRLASPIQ
jgi:hypothetical protein